MSYDRFCGGQLNSESNQDESIPLYTKIGSQIIWLQLVTGLREKLVLENLAKMTTNSVSSFFGGRRTYRNSLNEGYDGTGPGFRLRYSQLQNCVDSPFILNQ